MSVTKQYKFTANFQEGEEKTSANILIDGEIDSYWGVGLRQMADDITSSGASEIMIQINSVGGSVFEGRAIEAFIKGFPAEINTSIMGLCASIATPIALAGNNTSIARGSQFMIHNASSFSFGESKDLIKRAKLLDEINAQLVNTYVDTIQANGKLIDGDIEKTRNQIIEWMNAETWFSAEKAVEAGFIQELTDGVEFLTAENAQDIYNSCGKFKNVPAEFLNKVKNIAEMSDDKETKVIAKAKAPKGFMEHVTAFFTKEEEVKEVVIVEPKAELTKEEKIAEAKALLSEEGIEVVEAKIEDPVVEEKEEPTNESDQKLIELEKKFDALNLKYQNMQEQKDGSPTAGDGLEDSTQNSKKSLNKLLMPTAKHKAFFGDIAKALNENV